MKSDSMDACIIQNELKDLFITSLDDETVGTSIIQTRSRTTESLCCCTYIFNLLLLQAHFPGSPVCLFHRCNDHHSTVNDLISIAESLRITIQPPTLSLDHFVLNYTHTKQTRDPLHNDFLDHWSLTIRHLCLLHILLFTSY